MSDVYDGEHQTQRSEAGGADSGAGPQAPPRGTNWGAPPPPMPERKSPVVAGILSAIMPGAGQFYVGYVQRGFAFLAAFAIPITLLSNNAIDGAEPLLGIFLSYVWIFGIIDANRRAKAYNLALAGGSIPELPSDITLPEGRGSKLWGIVLIGGGFLLLMNTKFEFTLDWVAEWWPVGLILFGASIYLKARRAEQRENEGRSRL